jgi:hypothetical protein
VQRSALFIAVALGAPAAAMAAYQGPYHRADSSGTVYEVGGLFDTREDFQCQFSSRPLSGIVVRRAFAPNAIDLDGVVIEEESGERTFININDLPTDISMVERRWVVQGLQKMLKKGRRVTIFFWACGAAGRVLDADRILPTR